MCCLSLTTCSNKSENRTSKRIKAMSIVSLKDKSEPLTRSIHGHNIHRGKSPKSSEKKMFLKREEDDLKQELIVKGFKLLKDESDKSIFVVDKVKFDFTKLDKQKYMFTNRLTF